MKKECKIIEDLLFGYSDGTLNLESKKMVEEHLKECGECKEKYETIKNENEVAKDEVKALKLFKKFRRKNIIKTVLSVIIVFLVILIGIYLRKIFIISKIQNGIKNLYNSDNLYSEQISLIEDGQTSVLKKYYKDKKFKEVTSFYNDSGEFVFMTSYGDLEQNSKIIVSNYMNTYEIEENKKFNEETAKTIYLDLYDAFMESKFEIAFTMNIDIIENTWGKYYVFTFAEDKSKSYEFWVDAETLLPAKKVEKEARISYYDEDAKVIKNISDEITLYNYSFDTVTEEDLKIDLTNMKLAENN